MSKWEKLLSRLKSNSKDMTFTELKRILEFYGYEGKSPKGGSSHWTFRKSGKYPITIPKADPINAAYIKIVEAAIESEEN